MTDTANRLGSKNLSTVDCVAQSLAVGPVLSAVLLGSILAGLAGGVGPITLVFTVIGILGIGWTVSEFAKRYAGTGTVYEFIAHSLGKRAAVFAAGIYHLAVIALAAIGVPIVGGQLARQFFDSHMGINIPWWIWTLVIIAIIYVLNTQGIQTSIRAQLGVILFSLAPLAILSVKVVIDGGVSGNNFKSFNPGNVAEGGSIFKGLLFAILMFIGFELAAALGEETKDPKKSIPKAVIATILIVFAIYLITQYVLSIGSGGDIPPYFEAMGKAYVGNWLQIWIELGLILDVLAVGIGFCLAGSRGVFTLARDGMLPKGLARLNAKEQPIRGNQILAGAGVLFTLLTLAKYGTSALLDDKGVQVFPVREEAFWAFLICARLGGLIICLVYLMLCLGALKTFATKKPLDLVAALIGVVISVLGIASSFITGTKPAGDEKWGVTLSVVVVVLIAGWVGANWKRSDQVASYSVIHD
jgi:amino acid transporter